MVSATHEPFKLARHVTLSGPTPRAHQSDMPDAGRSTGWSHTRSSFDAAIVDRRAFSLVRDHHRSQGSSPEGTGVATSGPTPRLAEPLDSLQRTADEGEKGGFMSDETQVPIEGEVVLAPPDLDRYLDEATHGLILRNAGAGWFVATGANRRHELVVLAFRGSDAIGAIWDRLAEAPSPSRIDPARLDDADEGEQPPRSGEEWDQ
jgi:hypothetical protein